MPVRRPRPVLVHRRAASTAPKAICIAVALCIAGTAQAQTQTGDGGIAPSKNKSSTTAVDPKTLDTVQVTANQLGTVTEGSGSYTPGTIATATRLVLTPRETPQAISVITRQEIDDFGLTGIDDVMRVTPGVSIVTYDSERTEYYARGFAVQNFQYDGIPMQRDSAYSAGNTLSDLAIYDRIEVLKGATGLLTGVGDPGATINLIRKKPPRNGWAGDATLGAGSFRIFRTILLPLCWPSLVAGGILCWARALGELGATLIFAGNFQGRTQTMPLAVYETLQTDAEGAIALSIALLAICLLTVVAARGGLFREPR